MSKRVPITGDALTPKEPKQMTKAMVCAAQPEAVEAGAEVLAKGGNAIDAAIATALVQTAVDPQMCGIAGFGSAHIYSAAQNTHTLFDFHGNAPLAATPDMWADKIIGETEDGFGFILEGQVNEIGYRSITTPMSLAAFDEALSRFGTMVLGDLMQPAIAYCEDGFLVRPHVVEYWTQTATKGRVPHIDLITRVPGTAKIYQKADGSIFAAGEILKNPDMGRTYRRIAEHGAADFYGGAIANEILADMKANDGLLAAEDLSAARPTQTQPLWGTYRDLKIATNQPPGGGVMLLLMLNILENFDLAAMGHNSPAYIKTVAEAMKIATVAKDNHVGDPRFVDVPLERLTSKQFAAEMAERIKRGEITSVPRFNPDGKESAHTTHVCTLDKQGNCVSMTHSLGMPSGVVTDGLGFMYNGCMGVFDPRPGRPGSLAPGKSRFTAMCPSILFKDDRPCFIVGAPGGTYITMGVLQAILNAVDFGMSALEAVSAPRFSATSNVIEITNRILRSAERDLVTAGYQHAALPRPMPLPGVHAIRIGDDGRIDGGADPGRDGMAIAVD